MKAQRRAVMVVLLLAACLWLFAGPVAAQATRVQFTQTEVCPGFDQWQFEKMAFPDGNFHVRATFTCQDLGSLPEVAGTNHIVINGVWDANGFGPMWGTIHLVTETGTWDGSWTGQATPNGSVIRGVSQGSGAFQGWKMFSFGQSGKFSGYILKPGGK